MLKNKKWKPTRGIAVKIAVDLKTGKTLSKKIIMPKSQEEEEWAERQFYQRWLTIMEHMWGDKFYWFADSVKSLIDKYGEKEFVRRWDKEMQKQNLEDIKNVERQKGKRTTGR
ncbi:MAG: hypothetical protein NTV36_02240 [Candidatus Staskawiczbacteria bacterium]|nr:hypothetical protein [Candidatus Staskawiczbacteria bacterium]